MGTIVVDVLAVVVVWVVVCMRLECWLEEICCDWWCAGGRRLERCLEQNVVASFVVLPGEMPLKLHWHYRTIGIYLLQPPCILSNDKRVDTYLPGHRSQTYSIGIRFGVATSKLQLSVAPSVPFDGILLKHPRLMLVVAFGGAGMCWLGSGEEGWAGW